VGVVNLVLLACVLRVASKKGGQLFAQEKCTARENPGYAYGRGEYEKTLTTVRCDTSLQTSMLPNTT